MLSCGTVGMTMVFAKEAGRGKFISKDQIKNIPVHSETFLRHHISFKKTWSRAMEGSVLLFVHVYHLWWWGGLWKAPVSFAPQSHVSLVPVWWRYLMARNIRDSLHSMDLPRFDCSLLICSFTRWSQGQFDKDFLEKFQYMIISWNTQKKVALCADGVGQSCLFPHASTTSVLNVVLFRNMRLKRRLYPAHVLYIGWMSCCAMLRCITCLFDAI